MTKTFQNFIAGAWCDPASGDLFENRNPADTRDLIGRFPLSNAADVDRAVASAARGFDLWRRTPAPARGDVLRRVGDLLVKRKEELADLMTREMGKPLTETRGDVQEGIDTAYYAATIGRQLFGRTVPSEMPNKWAMSFRRPIGVAGIVTPFNFPLAIPTWKMFPALVCGNACVFKPAEDVPHTGHVLVEIMLDAGLPPEVIQLVHGLGEDVGRGDRGAPRRAGRLVHRIDRDRTAGGRNVWSTAQAAVAGDGRQERDDRHGRRRPRARARWRALGRVRDDRATVYSDEPPDPPNGNPRRIPQPPHRSGARDDTGDGRKKGTDVGPLIHESSRAKVERYVDIGQEDGADLVCGGRRAQGKSLEHGFFFEPTIFARVEQGMRIEQEEIFGPVLSVIRVADADEAFRVNNGVAYGLSSSLYTRDVSLAFRGFNELDNGITYINAPTIGAEAHLPFGGVKQTGNGHREGGWEVYEFYSETKVGYCDFSGALQRAQIDNYLGTPD
jgi:aldehyde dehydrogenase (NAD+)